MWSRTVAGSGVGAKPVTKSGVDDGERVEGAPVEEEPAKYVRNNARRDRRRPRALTRVVLQAERLRDGNRRQASVCQDAVADRLRAHMRESRCVIGSSGQRASRVRPLEVPGRPGLPRSPIWVDGRRLYPTQLGQP